ncbi:VCBS repeat-containing protein [Streptomyces sp. NPDC050848]|uniref:FG-GAP repeat domain-containing protein n=1 Tax=Streptomyces sp. NPDC050848 TaxID=3155791 RepID=UPI0033EA33B8
MIHIRVPRRRLAAAVTVVLTLTAGTALVAAPATAAAPAVAPAGVAPAADATAADATDGVLTIPRTYEILGVGPTGFLSSERKADGTTVHHWTSTTTGVTTELPRQSTDGYRGGGSDTVVAKEPLKTRYLLHDMSSPGDAPTVVEQPDSRLLWRGVVGRTLVFSSFDDASRTGVLRLIGEGNQEGHDRQVTGLPADARVLRTEAVSASTLLVRYATNTTGTVVQHIAVVDAATAAVVDDRVTGNAVHSVDFAASGPRWAWIESPTTMTAKLMYADRGGNGSAPATEAVDLGAGGRTHLGVLGADWLTYAVPGGDITVEPSPHHALTALDVTDGTKVKLLDHATSSVSAPDGSLLVRGGTVAQGEGVYRIALGADGKPAATLVASTGRPTALAVVGKDVPAVVDLDQNFGRATLGWTLSRTNAKGSVTLRHVGTGRTARLDFDGGTNLGDLPVTMDWDGMVETEDDRGAYAPSGDYTWELTATPRNGIGPDLKETGTFKVTRKAGAHDYTDNSTPDLLSRDASGVLWRDDTAKVASSSEMYSTERVRLGGGWQIYNQLEAVGNIAGAGAADLLARDAAGVLWLYQGKGDGAFTPRTKIGGGWNTYTHLTGGSDLDGDGKSDLLGIDTTGALWFYKGTGNASAPFGGRTKVGGGWGIYNQITATGNIAGSARGDLVARDKAGVLWLYQGSGPGAFSTRIRLGAGWNTFTQLVGVGDADRDGRADLYAVGAGGSFLYPGTGSASTPFGPRVANSVNVNAHRFNHTVF